MSQLAARFDGSLLQNVIDAIQEMRCRNEVRSLTMWWTVDIELIEASMISNSFPRKIVLLATMLVLLYLRLFFMTSLNVKISEKPSCDPPVCYCRFPF